MILRNSGKQSNTRGETKFRSLICGWVLWKLKLKATTLNENILAEFHSLQPIAKTFISVPVVIELNNFVKLGAIEGAVALSIPEDTPSGPEALLV